MFHRTSVHIIFSSVWVGEAILITPTMVCLRAKWKCEVFHRKRKLQKNTNNNIQMNNNKKFRSFKSKETFIRKKLGHTMVSAI